MQTPRPRLGALALASLLLLGPATLSRAQDVPDTGGRVFGLVGGSFGDGESAFLTSGGAGLRLTSRLGLDFEVMHVSGLDLGGEDDFRIAAPDGRPFFDLDRDGSVTTFLSRMVLEFPVGGRLTPFVSGGGGVGRVAEELEFRRSGDFDRPLPGRPELFGRGRQSRTLPLTVPRSFASTGLALSVGGGLDIRLWKGLSVGAEARWLRLLADRRTLDFAHIASRVAYRF